MCGSRPLSHVYGQVKPAPDRDGSLVRRVALLIPSATSLPPSALPSTLLLKGVATGQHFKDAVITFQSSDGRLQSPEYYTITMTTVFVTELSQTDSADPNRIFEKLVLNAGAFEFKYTPTDVKGKLGTPVSFMWDCMANKGG